MYLILRKDPMVCFLEDKSPPAEAPSASKIALQASLFALLDKILYFKDPKTHRRKVVVPAHLQKMLMDRTHRSSYVQHTLEKLVVGRHVC